MTRVHRTALIDTEARQSLIFQSALDELSTQTGANRYKNMSPMQDHHRFGNSGPQFEAEFSVKIPFTVDTDKGKFDFTVRKDFLKGCYPILIGMPALRKMQAIIDIASYKIHFAINWKSYRK